MVKSVISVSLSRSLLKSPTRPQPSDQAANLFKLIHVLGIDTASQNGLARTLTFTPGDTTAGAENEYQTAVVGDRSRVDLPCEIGLHKLSA